MKLELILKKKSNRVGRSSMRRRRSRLV